MNTRDKIVPESQLPPIMVSLKMKKPLRLRTSRPAATHGRFPEHFPAVFWTTFKKITLGCKAVPEKLMKEVTHQKYKNKIKQQQKELKEQKPQLLRETYTSAKHQVVDFHRSTFSDGV